MKTIIVEGVGIARLRKPLVYREEAALREFVNALVRKLRKVSQSRWLPRSARDMAAMYAFRLRPMMGASASDAAETDLLKLIFTAQEWANLAVDATASPATDITFALHTADPGESGDQSSNEADYGSYARATVPRDTGGFTVTGGSAAVNAAVVFPTSTTSGSPNTHFSVGTGVSDYMIASGEITTNGPIIVDAAGRTPQLGIGTAVICN